MNLSTDQLHILVDILSEIQAGARAYDNPKWAKIYTAHEITALRLAILEEINRRQT